MCGKFPVGLIQFQRDLQAYLGAPVDVEVAEGAWSAAVALAEPECNRPIEGKITAGGASVLMNLVGIRRWSPSKKSSVLDQVHDFRKDRASRRLAVGLAAEGERKAGGVFDKLAGDIAAAIVLRSKPPS